MSRFPFGFLLSTLLVAPGVDAATFCVDTANELQSALMTASSNGEADSVRIEAGLYEGISSIAFAYTTSESHAIWISGGYLSNCVILVNDPGLTVISGSGVRQALVLTGTGGSSGAQSLSNLTITDGATSQQGAGLFMGGATHTGDVTVTRVVIERNTATSIAGGMAIYTNGRAKVINNLFLLNRCGYRYCGLSATVIASNPTEIRAVFGNNTFVGNACASGTECELAGVRYGGSARSLFYNNVFAANTLGDLSLETTSGGSSELYHNNLVSLAGVPPVQSVGNIAVANPQFVDLLNDDLRPRFSSPLRNAGTLAFEYLQLDLAGRKRVNESEIDIGAFENQDRLFIDGFEALP
jgi:hypothetical protein